MHKKYTASSYVIDNEDRLLVLYHKKFQKWLQPGGHIEEGEEAWQCALREVFEETGIQIEIASLTPLIVKEYHTPIGIQIDYQFLGIPLNTDIVFNEEAKEARWIRKEEFQTLNVAEDLEEGYEAMLTLKRSLKKM